MPKKLESCVGKVVKQGKSKNSAYAICTDDINKKKSKNKKKK